MVLNFLFNENAIYLFRIILLITEKIYGTSILRNIDIIFITSLTGSFFSGGKKDVIVTVTLMCDRVVLCTCGVLLQYELRLTYCDFLAIYDVY